MSSFKDLNLIQPILKAIEDKKYITPTVIQQEAIPLILSGRDLLGCAQTGTGKTAAFSIPILQVLDQEKNNNEKRKRIKALIITPTRELASQIGENMTAYGKYTNISHAVIFGGVSQRAQVASLQKGIDILIATPGRLKDLMSQGYIDLTYIKVFVLDEADRMLDMGFINDIKFLLTKIPSNKQSIFFTATMSEEIMKLAGKILNNPLKVEVSPISSVKDAIEQSVYYVSKEKKKRLLLHLLENKSIHNALIFTRTKHGADRLSMDLSKLGIKSDAMHGGKSQSARQRALNDFKSKKNRVLVVTDVAARGIDIEKLSYVINYDIPNEPETYVHRIGRTGRAGENGIAMSFCDNSELNDFKQIKKLVLKTITEIDDHPYQLEKNSTPVINNKAKPKDKNKSNTPDKAKRNVSKWLRDKSLSRHRNSESRRSY